MDSWVENLEAQQQTPQDVRAGLSPTHQHASANNPSFMLLSSMHRDEVNWMGNAYASHCSMQFFQNSFTDPPTFPDLSSSCMRVGDMVFLTNRFLTETISFYSRYLKYHLPDFSITGDYNFDGLDGLHDPAYMVILLRCIVEAIGKWRSTGDLYYINYAHRTICGIVKRLFCEHYFAEKWDKAKKCFLALNIRKFADVWDEEGCTWIRCQLTGYSNIPGSVTLVFNRPGRELQKTVPVTHLGCIQRYGILWWD
jgi:hypothetical protein